VPQIGVLTSIFAIASLVHVPVFGVSAHLQVTGLVGIVLGPLAWPAIVVGLFLQATLFLHGSLTALGVNTLVVGCGAMASHLVFRGLRGADRSGRRPAVAAFVATIAAFVTSSTVFLAAMALASAELGAVARYCVVFNGPLAVVEAFVSSAAIAFVVRVAPELLEPIVLANVAGGTPS